MENEDIRWIQRLANFNKALHQLESGVRLASKQDFSDLEKEGLIQRFECTQELAWLVIKDFFESLGDTDIKGSKDAFRLAFRRGLIQNGSVFMESIKSRQLSVHTYNEEATEKVYLDIIEKYYGAFIELKTALEKEQKQRNL